MMAIIGHGSYGLTYGEIRATDEEIVRDKAVRVFHARNIRYWYGKNGGITSLAAYGPCGPRVSRAGGHGLQDAGSRKAGGASLSPFQQRELRKWGGRRWDRCPT